MAWQYHPILILFFLGGFVALGVTVYCLQYIRHHGRSHLVVAIGLLGAANTVWIFAAAFKTAMTTVEAKLLFYKLQFVGSWAAPSLAVVIALAYVGWERWLTRNTLGLLAAIPAVGVLLVLWNPGQVMIVDPILVDSHGVQALEHAFPPLFVLYLTWAIGSATLASAIFVYAAIRRPVPRKPALVGAFVFALPVTVLAFKLAGVYPPGGQGLNITPAIDGFAVSLLAVAIVRYRFLEPAPIGRDRAVEAMPTGYLLLDPGGEVLDANRAASDLLAQGSPRSLQGRSIETLLPDVDAIDASDTDEPVRLDTNDRIIEIRQSTVTRQHQPVGRLLLLEDVTEKIDYERDLERTNEQLRVLNRITRHDIRNDMNVAVGWSHELEAHVDEEGEVMLERIADTGNHVIELTNTVRDFVQALGTDEAVSVKPTDLDHVLRTELDKARSRYPDATFAVDGEIPPVTVIANELLSSVVRNILNNAVQHNDADDPHVTVRVDHDGQTVTVRIADDGPGIPDRQKKAVFGRGEEGLDDPAAGVGLYLVDQLVDSYDGDIRVEDNDPTGSVFVVELATADEDATP